MSTKAAFVKDWDHKEGRLKKPLFNASKISPRQFDTEESKRVCTPAPALMDVLPPQALR